MAEVSHAKLVKEAANWLRSSRGCNLVASELTTILDETPDVIGWQGELSILVECKTSRADFLADAKKNHRTRIGLGLERWFYIPIGLVKKDELPEGWGLLERKPFGDRHICAKTKEPIMRDLDPDLIKRERRMLVSIGWRALEALSLVKPFTIAEAP